jgi:reactive chlorine resistance protein C
LRSVSGECLIVGGDSVEKNRLRDQSIDRRRVFNDVKEHAGFTGMNADRVGARMANAGTVMLRYGLVVILLMIGATKWTPAEAEAIRPWVAHSPFLSWLYQVTTVQRGSEIIGGIEILTAVLIAIRRWLPRATVVGSLLAAGMFLITLSFLVTTPNQSPDAQGFLMKDFFLLGASIWSAGEAIHASALH